MKHPERVEGYLEHIVEAIARVVNYLEDISDFAAFKRDGRTRDAVVRNSEIIGEAANQIRTMSPEFIECHPELPWIEMRGMRNKIIHGYFDIELSVVWDTVRNDLPALKQQIEALLGFQLWIQQRVSFETKNRPYEIKGLRIPKVGSMLKA